MKCDFLVIMSLLAIQQNNCYSTELENSIFRLEKENGTAGSADNGSIQINVTDHYTSTTENSTDDIITLRESNFTAQVVTVSASSERISYRPKKELPLAMIIAGPTAAVSICLFLCIAYYFHNAQLNKKAARLSFTLYVSPEESVESTTCDIIPPAPRALKMVPVSPCPSPRLSRESDTPFNNQRRKSTLTVHTLGVPGNLQGKRGSNWSAFADQEILILSAPRRHSTFII